ncbi:MAG TPA: hypothetical protein VGJ53_00545 [Micromonosporaceae bacterium]
MTAGVSSAPSRAAGVRGLAAFGHFALRLGTGNAGDVTLLGEDFDGGNIHAEVISELSAGLHFATKRLGPPKYEEFGLPVGVAMSQELFGWVAGSWGAQPGKRDGAVLTLDHNLNIKTEAAFSGALITETTIPALDASSKDAGYLTVRFQPEQIDISAGGGKLSLAMSKQKLWRTSNFRLEIDGLDCTRVSKIDSFTVKREVVPATPPSPTTRRAARRPADPRTVVAPAGVGVSLSAGRVEFPNLVVTLSEVSAQTWFDWHESFVVNGNNSDGFERSGSLTFLSADLKKELSRIDLHHLGIVRLAPVKGQASQVARVIAELYCEEMLLSPVGGSS